MKITYIKKDKRLIFEIEEDIDECCVQKIRRRIDNEIQRYMPKEVIFDFSNVSFMDSAGIGLIIGINKHDWWRIKNSKCKHADTKNI